MYTKIFAQEAMIIDPFFSQTVSLDPRHVLDEMRGTGKEKHSATVKTKQAYRVTSG